MRVLGIAVPGAAPESSAPPVAALIATALAGMAIFAGMATAIVGSTAGYRAIYYVSVLVILVAGSVITLTRREPLRFAFLALIVCFPIAIAELPPGRFQLTIFDAVMAALAIGLLWKKISGSATALESLFPTRSFLLACLLIVPCIVFSQYPLWSLQIFTFKQFTVYVFFLFTLDELKREGGFERLVLLLSIVLLVMAAGLYLDRFLHLSLSMQGSNVNQMTYSDAGVAIYRAGGFFQDPQKAGAYLACMITFLVLLSVRGRFRGMRMRYLVWAAVAFSLGALMTTIARSAILACLSVSAIALLAFNRWNAAVKLAILGGVLAIAVSLALTPAETWLNVLPVSVSERFHLVGQDLANRTTIWFDTWDMFADHPITGIGTGSFQPYLLATRPTISSYYGIGESEGMAYIPTDPESGYLKILYETGILGSLAALLIVGDAFRQAIIVMLGTRTSPAARTEVVAALAALVTFGVTFVTLYTPADERIAALFAVFLAVILRRSLQHDPTPQKT